jgi:hypothetical protein
MGDLDSDDFGGDLGQLYFNEWELKLSDVWEEDGKARQSVVRGGQVVPLYYLYDFGVSALSCHCSSVAIAYRLTFFSQDNWDHKIDFVLSHMTSCNNPLKVISAMGCGPLDNSGGVMGWQEVKLAFSKANPNTWKRDKKSWANDILPLGMAFDPSKTPSLEELNKEGEFEEFAKFCRRGEGNGEDNRDPDNM